MVTIYIYLQRSFTSGKFCENCIIFITIDEYALLEYSVIDLSSHSVYAHEKEVLLQPENKYIVNKVELEPQFGKYDKIYLTQAGIADINHLMSIVVYE